MEMHLLNVPKKPTQARKDEGLPTDQAVDQMRRVTRPRMGLTVGWFVEKTRR
jgi:hypothetical protein